MNKKGETTRLLWDITFFVLLWGQFGAEGEHVWWTLLQEEKQFSHHLLLKECLNCVKVVKLDESNIKIHILPNIHSDLYLITQVLFILDEESQPHNHATYNTILWVLWIFDLDEF